MKLKDLMRLFMLVMCVSMTTADGLYAKETDADDSEEVAPKKKKAKVVEEDGDDEEAPKPRKKKAKKAPVAPSRMIVVMDKFDNKATIEPVQLNTLRSRIQHRIIGTRKFEVMEREQMKSILSEQKLAAAGITNGDDVDAPESGKLKAAGYVFYANILSFGNEEAKGATAEVSSTKMTVKMELQVKFSNGETGKVLASRKVIGVGTTSKVATEGVSQSGNWSEQIMNAAIDDAAAQAVDLIRDICYPAVVVRVGKNNVTINMTAEEVQEDDVFDVLESTGKPMTDPSTGAFLGYDGDELGRVRITRTGPMVSKAEPIDGLDLDDIEEGCILRRVPVLTLKKEAKKRKAKAQEAFESRF